MKNYNLEKFLSERIDYYEDKIKDVIKKLQDLHYELSEVKGVSEHNHLMCLIEQWDKFLIRINAKLDVLYEIKSEVNYEN